MKTSQCHPSFSHFTQSRAVFVTDKWLLATIALYFIQVRGLSVKSVPQFRPEPCHISKAVDWIKWYLRSLFSSKDGLGFDPFLQRQEEASLVCISHQVSSHQSINLAGDRTRHLAN